MTKYSIIVSHNSYKRTVEIDLTTDKILKRTERVAFCNNVNKTNSYCKTQSCDVNSHRPSL